MSLDNEHWDTDEMLMIEDMFTQPGDTDLLDFDEHELVSETDATFRPEGRVRMSSSYPGSEVDSEEEAESAMEE